MASEREIDSHSQTETTGHEWDGIKELNTPLPRWWLWTFYACIIWAVGYMLFFPAWPLISSATPGILGYSSRADAARELETARAANAPLDAQLMAIELAAIAENPDLLRYAVAGGGAVFRNHCSQCHGAGAGGAVGGYPNLLDDDWLWGGSIDEIHLTISHGIRYDPDPDTRFSQMPAYGDILPADEIDGLVEYVLSLSGTDHDAEVAAAHAESFLNNCAACHGEDGQGDYFQGAPNLADEIWLYGGSRETIRHTIQYSRYGIMPSFSMRLTEAEVRKAAVYVHNLGGGQ